LASIINWCWYESEKKIVNSIFNLVFYIVNIQIFHDSVKNVYRILSVDGSKVLINTIVTARMTFTKTSQKFCQWIDSKANHVYGLGFTNEIDLTRVDLFNKKLIFSNLFNNFLVYG
jgi:hypothetical protein